MAAAWRDPASPAVARECEAAGKSFVIGVAACYKP
jgi:hypothetical protein